LSRDRLSLGADFLLFSRRGAGRVSFASDNVFCLHFRRLVRQCGCTKHLLRVDRHHHGNCREPVHDFLRPRNISVPSYRPTQKRGCTSLCASEAQVRVRGSTQLPRVALAVCTGAEAGVQSNAQGQGIAPMCSGAFADAGGASLPSTVVRLTPWGPSAAPGSPAPLPELERN